MIINFIQTIILISLSASTFVFMRNWLNEAGNVKGDYDD